MINESTIDGIRLSTIRRKATIRAAELIAEYAIDHKVNAESALMGLMYKCSNMPALYTQAIELHWTYIMYAACDDSLFNHKSQLLASANKVIAKWTKTGVRAYPHPQRVDYVAYKWLRELREIADGKIITIRNKPDDTNLYNVNKMLPEYERGILATIRVQGVTYVSYMMETNQSSIANYVRWFPIVNNL